MTDFTGGLSKIIKAGKNITEGDIVPIEIEKLVAFKDSNGIVNPSEVDENDPEFIALKKNISERGLDHPITVRPLPEDKEKYQILCGHHRAAACRALGQSTIRAIVRNDLSDEAAAELVGLDNFSRKKNYKPSEKAKFYKMVLDARKRKSGRRIEGTEAEGSALEEISAIVGESERSIQNYIRLSSLIPELLEMVDEKKVKMIPAVELSYIPETAQKLIYKYVSDNEISITAAQAKELREKATRSELTETKIEKTLGVERKGKKNPYNRKVKQLIPDYIKADPDAATEYLIKAIRFYQEHNKDIESQGE